MFYFVHEMTRSSHPIRAGKQKLLPGNQELARLARVEVEHGRRREEGDVKPVESNLVGEDAPSCSLPLPPPSNQNCAS